LKFEVTAALRLVRSGWERGGRSAKIEGGTAVVCNVPVAGWTQDDVVLPEAVQEAAGQLLGAAKEGLLVLSVEVGLGVLRELLEEEVEQIVGPKGRWNRDRTAVRYGHEERLISVSWRTRS
jgi:hypothetical protein